MNSFLKQLRWPVRAVLFVSAFLTMGVAMPSCPGQQAMQQQIDSLATGSAEESRKVQALDAQLKTANTDLANLKQLSEQMATQITAQKAAIDQLTGSMKDMDTKIQAMTVKPVPHKATRPTGGAHRH